MGIINTNVDPIDFKRAKIAEQVEKAPRTIAGMVVAPIFRAIFNDRQNSAQELLAGWNGAAAVLAIYHQLDALLTALGEPLPTLPFIATPNEDGTVTLDYPSSSSQSSASSDSSMSSISDGSSTSSESSMTSAN